MAVGGVPDLNDIADIEENIQAQNEEITVLQSIFEGDEDRLHILESAEVTDLENGDIGHQNMLKMYIPVKCPEKLHIDIHLPLDLSRVPVDDNDGKLSEGKPASGGLQVARSESGQRVIFSFEVSYLPPVCVHVTLPQSYPSNDPPSFVISCVWLSPQQLTLVCQEFDRLWLDYKGDADSPGMPILYTWLDWVQENLLKTLGIDSQISVTSHSIDEDVDDCRVVMETEDLNGIVTEMIRYNRQEEVKVFFKSEQECSICFEQNLGTKFFLLPECNHYVCQECVTSHCQLLVKEGSVLQIRCPMYKCKASIPPYILKEVLSEEEFTRFESLSLMKGLQVMGDVTWCPRCNNAVIQEPEQDLNLAHCLVCFFTFCTDCMDKWHQGERCPIDVEIEKKQREINEKDKERKEHERKEQQEHERRRLEQHIQNRHSKNYITKMAKRCPKCRAPIMKTGGCNKVVCANCQTSMCFSCERKIDGYDHFAKNESCNTFSFEDDIIDNTDIREPQRQGFMQMNNAAVQALRRPVPETTGKLINDRIKDNPKLREQSIRCPTCKQTNIKETPSNHLHCWNCKQSICFYCKQKINGPVGKHYTGVSSCPQHSAL